VGMSSPRSLASLGVTYLSRLLLRQLLHHLGMFLLQRRLPHSSMEFGAPKLRSRSLLRRQGLPFVQSMRCPVLVPEPCFCKCKNCNEVFFRLLSS
jgi:hypothetical protein